MGGKYSRSKGEAKCIKIGLEAFWRGKKKKRQEQASVLVVVSMVTRRKYILSNLRN